MSLVFGAMLSGMPAPPEEGVKISDLKLNGEIEGENIVFSLAFTANASEGGETTSLVKGDVAYLDGDLPGKSELCREKDSYLLRFGSGGRQDVLFRFASRAVKDGDWRSTGFSIPGANIRKVSVVCDRNDLEIKFPGALAVKRSMTKEKKTMVTAFLGIEGGFEVRWKPEVKKLDADLAVSCEANTITTASVGAIRLETVFTYRVIQGSLTELSLDLPGVNITRVRGLDIQDWKIDRSGTGKPRLVVRLSRPNAATYRLRV